MIDFFWGGVLVVRTHTKTTERLPDENPLSHHFHKLWTRSFSKSSRFTTLSILAKDDFSIIYGAGN